MFCNTLQLAEVQVTDCARVTDLVEEFEADYCEH